MDIKSVLHKSITALYYYSHSNTSSGGRVREALEYVLSKIDLPDDPLERSKERSSLVELNKVFVWLLDRNIGEPLDKDDLLARIQLATSSDDRLYEPYAKTIRDIAGDPDKAIQKHGEYMVEIFDYVAVTRMCEVIRKYSHQISYEPSSISDLAMWRSEVMDAIQSVGMAQRKTVNNELVKIIDVSDPEAVEAVFQMAQETTNPDHILSYPWKAANRMTGEQDGARRGEWANISALSGNNKTGTLLDWFVGFCIFNKPKLIDEGCKPLHVYFTIEDPVESVFQKLYVLLAQHEHQLPVSLRGLTPKEMTNYVMDKLQANGWNVKICQLPNGGDPNLYIDTLQSFIDDGYEIFTVGCDYPNLLDKTKIPAVVAGDETKGMHRFLRAWTAPRYIFGYNAHQLSSEARQLSRQFPEDYLERLENKGYYEGSRQLNTEFDYEIFTGKIMKNDQAWQVFVWGKHRKIGATDEKHKYFAMKYYPVGMLNYPYDVHLEDEDHSRRRVGDQRAGDSGGALDFDMGGW